MNVGFSLRRAAKLVRVEPEYLRRVEIHGGAPYVLAVRLSRLYQCSMQIFLYTHVRTAQGQSERFSPRCDRITSKRVAKLQSKNVSNLR
jgi:hypothetical protein